MTRTEAIAILTSTSLPANVGMGDYSDSAAYKLANGDISANTPGLSDDVVAAIVAVGGELEFEQIGR